MTDFHRDQVLRNVARGMRFLHEARPPLLHGGLAASNVLVDGFMCAKVRERERERERECVSV